MGDANTVWMLVATSLVLLMTPALGFFYAGLVRAKNAINTLMMSFAALAFVGLGWALLGYSLAFDAGGPLVGGLSAIALRQVDLAPRGTTPQLLFMAFQGSFAIITAALVSGAVAERMRFGAYLAFLSLWSLVVYAPVAHWVWGGGWLSTLGVLDFAGGTVVHINAGVAAVAAALVLGARREQTHEEPQAHHIPFTLLGAALLWFGWFGFNGGSALAADSAATLAFVNTLLAPMATIVVWLTIDALRHGRASAVSLATAAVVGLVAITPAAGYVGPLGAIGLGALAAFPSYLALRWRPRSRLDDALDVFAAHGVGGISGALLTGLLAQQRWNGSVDGLLFGHPGQLLLQLVGVLAVATYSGLATVLVLKVIALVLPLRVSALDEEIGLDLSLHGEHAYPSAERAAHPTLQPAPVEAQLAGTD